MTTKCRKKNYNKNHINYMAIIKKTLSVCSIYVVKSCANRKQTDICCIIGLSATKLYLNADEPQDLRALHIR